MRSLTTNTAPGSAGQNGAHTLTARANGIYEGDTCIAVVNIIREGGLGFRVAQEKAAARARLFAAAPQMLDALREALPTFEERAAYFGIESGPLVAIRAAIAAATGEEG